MTHSPSPRATLRPYSCNGEGGPTAGGGWDHCCYLGGKVCPYLVENQGGRRYACALMLQYGSWDEVIASPEYRPVGIHWKNHTNPEVRFSYCRDFDPAFCCRPEFKDGRRSEFSEA